MSSAAGSAAAGPAAIASSMWLILHEREDVDAIWAARALEARDLRPLELVTAHDLANARRWEHRIAATGASSVLELRDGRTIRSAQVTGALNRLIAVPPDAVARAAAADRDYAMQELYALFTSWLDALPGTVLNRPSPQALAGPWLSVAEWISFAALVGLDVPIFRRSGTNGARVELPNSARRAVLVVGGRALAPVGAPPAVRAGAGQLAQLVHAGILEIGFRVDVAGRWIFSGADATPPLRRYGAMGINLLAQALRARPT